MCARAPNMHWPLANSRLNLKLSPKMLPADCAAMIDAITKYMESDTYANRFQPASEAELIEGPSHAREFQSLVCDHNGPKPLMIRAASFAAAMKAHILHTCAFVYQIVSIGDKSVGNEFFFVAPYSYKRLTYCARGKIDSQDQRWLELSFSPARDKLPLLVSSYRCASRRR